MFRWGVLSTAKIAREHVIPAIQQSHRGVVAGIASRDVARARAVAECCQIPRVYDNYDAMLRADDIDGVYIAVTTAQHVEWTLAAIAAGKPVLCEKPLALDTDTVARVADAADAAGVLVAEAFMVHYHPQWARVRDWIAEGAIGELKHVQGAFSYRNVDPDNMRNRPELGGGAVPDIGVYPVVTTRFVSGCEPLSASARIDRDPEFGTDRYAAFTLAFPGFDAQFYVSSQMHLYQSMHFAGTTGWIAVDAPFNAGNYGHAVVRLNTPAGEQVVRFADNQYALQADAFAEAATGGANRCFTLENSVHNQRAIDAIYRAAASAQVETVA
ncbi:MAG: Gfo/Idh/MocA family oxidoreductase [Pseudomonadota bacterium]